MHVHNEKKDILVPGEGLTQGLYDTRVASKTKYSINFVESRKRVVLSLYYNRSNSFLFVNATKKINSK